MNSKNPPSTLDFIAKWVAILEDYRKREQNEEYLKSRTLPCGDSIDAILKRINERCKGENKAVGEFNNNKQNLLKAAEGQEKYQILAQYFGNGQKNEIRSHVIQGPPGTGKTEISAFYVLAFIYDQLTENKKAPLILVSATVHSAIENILLRVERYFPLFHGIMSVDAANLIPSEKPLLRLIKVQTFSDRSTGITSANDVTEEEDTNHSFRQNIVFGTHNKHSNPPNDCIGLYDLWLDETKFANLTGTPAKLPENFPFDAEIPTVVGITPSQVIKFLKMLKKADMLLIDEASVMMIPEYVIVQDSVKPDGLTVVVGDDLQLGPITQNPWPREIRPELVEHKPWNSVFHHLRSRAKPSKNNDNRNSPLFKSGDQSIAWASLETTYRFENPALTKLISPTYKRFGISLKETKAKTKEETMLKCSLGTPSKNKTISIPVEFLANATGVRLITYDSTNDFSTKNVIEADAIVAVFNKLIENHKPEDIVVVTPYHDQIDLLNEKFKENTKTKKKPYLINTVNKLQGNEKDVIMFSACASGEEALLRHGSFVLELQRTIVAFSRAKKLLIVFASESLLSYIPIEYQQYQASLLWKNLRDSCIEYTPPEVQKPSQKRKAPKKVQQQK